MKIDYLIIGQGLAGSLLAWELIQRQKKVFIVDNNQSNASLVAAGLINPVTGMRFVKSTEVDHLLPSAYTYYQKLSQRFAQSFYIEKPMLRLLRHSKELSACQKRLHDPAYSDFLDKILPSYSGIESKLGLLKQNKTAYLLTQPLLTALKQYFMSINAFIKADIQYPEISLSPCLNWKGLQPKKIIFCEGHLAIHNPWFSYLPFQLVKGEIITAKANQDIQQNILNYGHWFIPLDNRTFRTGASFDRENLNSSITTAAKNTLINSLQQIYPSLNIERIIKQQAGIRPTTLDKMPFVGTHPFHPELLIFNGFGAKGSLQIPWHCQQLAEHLINKKPISETSDICRYHALF